MSVKNNQVIRTPSAVIEDGEDIHLKEKIGRAIEEYEHGKSHRMKPKETVDNFLSRMIEET